jgi:hypothetical protein
MQQQQQKVPATSASDAAKRTLERALQALPQRKHVKVRMTACCGAAWAEVGQVVKGSGSAQSFVFHEGKCVNTWTSVQCFQSLDPL